MGYFRNNKLSINNLEIIFEKSGIYELRNYLKIFIFEIQKQLYKPDFIKLESTNENKNLLDML